MVFVYGGTYHLPDLVGNHTMTLNLVGKTDAEVSGQ